MTAEFEALNWHPCVRAIGSAERTGVVYHDLLEQPASSTRSDARNSFMNPSVVVITPVRNEAWILDRFLAVTSRFADLIVVADQRSTDGSRDIYPKYPKVVVVDNPDAKYDEASRQRLLIDEARQRVPGPRVLLALDVDEVFAADAPNTLGWQTALGAPPGTVLCFEKPDLLPGVGTCIRYDTPWPIGYVDDGAEHVPRAIHSLRIPTPDSAPRLYVNDVKVLHYALTRVTAQRAKVRMYSMVEAVLGTIPLRARRRCYAAGRDWRSDGRVGPVLPSWLTGWEQAGIDMTTVRTERFYWHDYECLRLFAAHGARRFWFDDVWDQDWEACRRAGLQAGQTGLLETAVRRPPAWATAAGRGIDAATGLVRRLKPTRR